MKINLKSLVSQSKSFLKLSDTNKDSSTAYDSEFAALFYIRNTSVELDKDLENVLKILKTLEDLNKKSTLILETNCSPTESILWKGILDDIHNNLSQVTQQLNYLKRNIISKSKVNDFLFWQHNQNMMDQITKDYERLGKTALNILPQGEKMYWRSAISQVREEMFTAIILRISICKQEFDFISQHTPLQKTSTNMQNLVNSIPLNYTLDEAQKFVQDNRKTEPNEIHNYKNKYKIWDSFVHLLDKGVAKPSSEKTMANS